MPEQLALNECFWNGCTVQRNKGTLTPTTIIMESFRNQLFPCAALAGDQDSRAAIGDLFNLGVDLLHSRTLSVQVVEGIAPDHLRAELFDLLLEVLIIQCALDDNAKFLHVEGFRKIVNRAELHGINRGFDRFRSGEHDHRGRATFSADGLENREPVGAWQDYVQ